MAPAAQPFRWPIGYPQPKFGAAANRALFRFPWCHFLPHNRLYCAFFVSYRYRRQPSIVTSYFNGKRLNLLGGVVSKVCHKPVITTKRVAVWKPDCYPLGRLLSLQAGGSDMPFFIPVPRPPNILQLQWGLCLLPRILETLIERMVGWK